MAYAFHQDTLILVCFQYEVCGSRKHTVERGKVCTDELGDLLQALSFDEQQ